MSDWDTHFRRTWEDSVCKRRIFRKSRETIIYGMIIALQKNQKMSEGLFGRLAS